MEIWVDADACPREIKEILYRAAERVQVRLTLVANRALGHPRSPYLRAVRVKQGFDVADNHIVRHMKRGIGIQVGHPGLASLQASEPSQNRRRFFLRDLSFHATDFSSNP